jgi:hypothetical protein
MGMKRHLLICQNTHNLYYSNFMIKVDCEKVKKLVSVWLNDVVLNNMQAWRIEEALFLEIVNS